MKTDDFIAQLVADAYPNVQQRAHWGKSIAPLLLGIALSIALLVSFWGVHPALMTLAQTGLFEFKVILLTLVALIALHTAWLIARPYANLSRIAWQSSACVTAMLLITVAPLSPNIPTESVVLAQSHAWALASVPSDMPPNFSWTSVWHTSGAVACLSLPVFAGLMWLMRHMGPTHPALAGASAGFAATVMGMLEFAFNAPYDLSLCFCISYLLCIATLPAIGAWIGHRWLRW
ncbi:MAG: hypothetical protein RLY90_1124 [Pseudomonadota bacterium]|jgi:hypothetical protein